jgi:hypothetical protein
VYSCFCVTAEEDQGSEYLEGFLRTSNSNYTRFFEELCKYNMALNEYDEVIFERDSRIKGQAYELYEI